MIGARILLPWLLLAQAAAANPYLAQVQTAVPMEKEIERAREQVSEPRTGALSESLLTPPFHKRSSPHQATASLCRGCHRDAPHHGDPARRAFLNMHSRHMACETCHWRPEGLVIEYRYDGARPQSLIVPWAGGERVFTVAGHPVARQILEAWESSDAKARAELKARLHHPLSREGPGCGRCHGDQDALMDPQSLGYDEERTRALRLNPIARFLERIGGDAETPPRRIHLRDLLE